MFHRNVGNNPPKYRTSYPKRPLFIPHGRKNVKSHSVCIALNIRRNVTCFKKRPFIFDLKHFSLYAWSAVFTPIGRFQFTVCTHVPRLCMLHEKRYGPKLNLPDNHITLTGLNLVPGNVTTLTEFCVTCADFS